MNDFDLIRQEIHKLAESDNPSRYIIRDPSKESGFIILYGDRDDILKVDNMINGLQSTE
jgi:hypothetical protein